jgi:hypothetical protein
MAITVPTYIRYIRVVINEAPQVLFDAADNVIINAAGEEVTN